MSGGGPGADAGHLQLHVASTGTGDPVVLLHGFGASSFTWRRWIPELSRRYRVLAVDLKGFGAAPKPRDGCYAPADLAAEVHALVVRRDLRRVTLVGHSLGGGIALLVALRLLDDGEGRLSRVVSVGGVAYRQTIPPYVELVRKNVVGRMLFALLPARWLIERVLQSIVHAPGEVTAEQVAGYADPLRSRDARRALTDCARQIVPDDLDEVVARYPEIDVPVLLLWGRSDRVVPLSVARRLAGELPRGRLVVLEGCGHIPPEEQPDQSLRHLLDFLSEGDATATGAS